MANSLPFVLLTAFANHSSGGNPAAVVFLEHDLPTDCLQTIARNLNQPITAFVSTQLELRNDRTAAFGIRWFTTEIEAPLCGHGTLAAAKAVFTREGLVSGNVDIIEFRTVSRGTMTARKVDGSWIEIQLPSTIVDEVSSDERNRLQLMVAKAFGKESIAVNFIAKGGKGFEYCLMVELDEIEDLASSNVDANALRNTGYDINVITTASSSGNEAFVSRMFSPHALLGGEDHVCGSAHCLITPHWAKKQGLEGQEIKAKQVSRRGGDLKLMWEEGNGILKLRGELAMIGKGELML